MITNATLLRIDAQNAPTKAGSVSWTAGGTIDVRCLLDAPTSHQRHALGAIIADAKAVMYVETSALGESALATGGKVTIELDEVEPATTYRIVHRNIRVKGTLTHEEVFLQQ